MPRLADGFHNLPDLVDLAGPFASSEEAEAYRREHENELAEKLAKMRELPSERRADNAPRVGEDLRNGRDVTPEMFSEAFGFRGVEFGNWVGNEQRQADLNNAFDALTDLAGVLGISSRAISLNGELGLAFGARGRGGKNPQNAHYETRRVVINLTRTRGAGSLAHEWLHALDNYFSRMQGKSFAEEYLSDDPGVAQASHGEKPVYIHKTPRQEIIEAWGLVRKAIRESGMRKRSDALDRLRTKPYWGTDVEMTARAFERYIIEKLRGRKASNDYLANIRSEEEWKAASGDRSYPYPTSDEMPAITAAFDNLFETIEERQTDRGVALASIAPGEHLPPAGNA
uniref:LPD1 domain-containing protein n=1 Tax=uncultured Desulfovibrio sp. TaxID=167968 RepID=UPI002608E5D8